MCCRFDLSRSNPRYPTEELAHRRNFASSGLHVPAVSVGLSRSAKPVRKQGSLSPAAACWLGLFSRVSQLGARVQVLVSATASFAQGAGRLQQWQTFPFLQVLRYHTRQNPPIQALSNHPMITDHGWAPCHVGDPISPAARDQHKHSRCSILEGGSAPLWCV